MHPIDRLLRSCQCNNPESIDKNDVSTIFTGRLRRGAEVGDQNSM